MSTTNEASCSKCQQIRRYTIELALALGVAVLLAYMATR